MPILGVTTIPGSGGGGGTTDPGTTDPDVGTGGSAGSGGGGVAVTTLAEPILSLTTADGTVFDLADPAKHFATHGWRGFDAPTYTVYADETPMFDGEIFRGARAQPRDLIVAVYLRGDTRDQFLTRKRELLAKLSPKRGLATLQVAETDGSRRRIDCYFTGRGAEGEGSPDRFGPTWVAYNLELRCPEPYWRGDPLHVVFTAPTSEPFLGSPFLPLQIRSAQSFGATQLTNPGDVKAYPVWQITGPASEVTLTQNTPGATTRTLTLEAAIAGGETITIDTRPDRLAITDQDGINHWPDLADDSALWELAPGLNSIDVIVAGSSSATRVVLDAEPRYETV